MKRRKRTRTLLSPELEKLLRQLKEWFEDDNEKRGVGIVQNANEAATAVLLALEQATYDESLNGWWKWYSRALNEVPGEALREKLGSSVLQEARQASTRTEELQLAKLPPCIQAEPLPHQDLVEVLKQILPHKLIRPKRTEAKRLAGILWPMVEHDNGPGFAFDFYHIQEDSGRIWREDTGKGKSGLERLIFRLWLCAQDGVRAITLSLRICEGSRLDEVCQALDKQYGMTSTICPESHWCQGPPTQQAAVESEATDVIRNQRLPFGMDKRFYLIIGTPGALTKSHWDRGIQTVLYHTLAGTNHALAVPRSLAQMQQALSEGAAEHMLQADDDGARLATWHDDLEYRVLRACESVTKAGTFAQGETMLIMPGGGHAVLTGDDGKVVLAGEWHLRTDI